MTPFVDAMRIALKQKAWERPQAAETSSRTQTTPSSAQPQGSVSYSPSKGSSDAFDETLVDSQLVGMLVAMGYSRERAAKAALETGNTGIASKADADIVTVRQVTVRKINYANVPCMQVISNPTCCPVLLCCITRMPTSACPCHSIYVYRWSRAAMQLDWLPV